MQIEEGTITIRRRTRFFGLAVRLHVEIDGLWLAALRPGREETVSVAAGDHQVWARMSNTYSASNVKVSRNQNITITCMADGVVYPPNYLYASMLYLIFFPISKQLFGISHKYFSFVHIISFAGAFLGFIVLISRLVRNGWNARALSLIIGDRCEIDPPPAGSPT